MYCYPCQKVEDISPKPDLGPVNVKLSSCNGPKLPVVSKCLFTLAHKNNSFEVLYVAVDSDSTNPRIKNK